MASRLNLAPARRRRLENERRDKTRDPATCYRRLCDFGNDRLTPLGKSFSINPGEVWLDAHLQEQQILRDARERYRAR